jgi:myo-inositol-1(or 4)-monophosphatase
MREECVAQALVAAALEGGEIVRESFQSGSVRVEGEKSRGNFVTNIDLRVQERVFRSLHATLPGVPVVGEESECVAIPEEAVIVDPLDGTLNFMHGYHEVAVSLGYWKRGKPVAGAVYNPITDDLFQGAFGYGALRNGSPVTPTTHTELYDCLLATGWPYERREHPLALSVLGRFASECQEVRISGSAALNICYVAAGALDGYWEWGLFPWDLAGGAAVALAAGCRLSTRTGEEFDVAGNEILVSNGAVHAEMLGVFAAGEAAL